MCLFASIRTVCVREKLLSQVFFGRSEKCLAAMTLEVPSTWLQPCVCVFIGHGPFECTGVRMGSVCGKYFDHIPKKIINKDTMVDHKNTACSHISVTTVRDNSLQMALSHYFSVTPPFSEYFTDFLIFGAIPLTFIL